MLKSKLINFNKFEDPRGSLTSIEQLKDIPFIIRRVYWIYDVPGGQIRGGHAFKKQKEMVIALSGSFDVKINNGKTEVKYHLNRSYFGVYIPNGLWRSLENFSTNSVALILSSTPFHEDDYIRLFSNFHQYRNGKK